ncbi:MAG: AAA family ATPase [Elusimicrobiota bacterium]|jgi:ATP-dependent exoDNAse (exonuclease V) alpha subunit|nr:AAA family ATPase [Elusimicrobiota bacterium]
MQNLEITEEFKQAYNLINNTNYCVFITGNAGTGKTTFLNYCLTRLKKKTVTLATTGVAALNCGGETVHSFFKFKPGTTVSKIKKRKNDKKTIYTIVETIIIDEVSMLRADILDCIDRFLKLNRDKPHEPFGGVQMVFIGDLQQLPPVVTRDEKAIFESVYKSPYFLSAHSLNECMLYSIELKKIYRQQDKNFIAILNSIRNGTVGDFELAKLNERVSQRVLEKGLNVYLTTTNKKASSVNNEYLTALPHKEFVFEAEAENVEKYSDSIPAELNLTIKKESQVMMLNNDSQGRWVNGTIGKICEIKTVEDSDKALIYVEFLNGRIEEIKPYKWDIFRHKWNEAEKMIEAEKVGYFKQYPIKLSWAVTIHKSQGKTFDNIIVDMEYGAFVPGQLYVALSRCTKLEGITLSRRIGKRDILAAKVKF